MSFDNQRQQSNCCALIACSFFLFAGLSLIPHLGIEGDEPLFATAIYQPRSELFSIHIRKMQVPVMLLSYLGALKSWIYRPILNAFGAGPITLRVPMLLAGVASLWLFFLLLRRIAGDRAASIGCGLLAADSMYLVTICFDWGPVALQHLLLLGGMLLLMRFYQERSAAALFWGVFLLGLGLWDKALAVWMLSGMAVAGMLTLRRQIVDTFTYRRLAIAILGFALGSMPLIVYNAKNHWVTFGGNFHRDTTDIPGKARFLMLTAGGPGLFGWMISEDWETPAPHQPSGALARASAQISSVAGHPRHHLLLYGFILALLLTPWVRGNALRAIAFSLIAIAVAWVQMAITANTGGSVHHTILLWPLPELVIAVSFASASRRLGRAGIPVVAAVVAVMIFSGALVINEYRAVMLRNGGSQGWSNAVYPLSDYLKEVPATHVICMDWGIQETLQLLHRGRLQLAMGDSPISKTELSADDREVVERMISEPGNLYIAHTPAFEFFPGRSSKLIKFAEESGYRREMMRIVSDGFGHPFFEVYRFTR